jgi:hypothetical protein
MGWVHRKKKEKEEEEEEEEEDEEKARPPGRPPTCRTAAAHTPCSGSVRESARTAATTTAGIIKS